jgi:hypothetical protein
VAHSKTHIPKRRRSTSSPTTVQLHQLGRSWRDRTGWRPSPERKSFEDVLRARELEVLRGERIDSAHSLRSEDEEHNERHCGARVIKDRSATRKGLTEANQPVVQVPTVGEVIPSCRRAAEMSILHSVRDKREQAYISTNSVTRLKHASRTTTLEETGAVPTPSSPELRRTRRRMRHSERAIHAWRAIATRRMPKRMTLLIMDLGYRSGLSQDEEATKRTACRHEYRTVVRHRTAQPSRDDVVRPGPVRIGLQVCPDELLTKMTSTMMIEHAT